MIVLSRSKNDSTECSGRKKAATPLTTIKKTAQIPRRMYFDFSASLSTIFFWLLLTFGIGFFRFAVSSFSKGGWFSCLYRLCHYFLNIFFQMPWMSFKKNSLFLICSHNFTTKPTNVKSRIRNFRLSFISITEASVPIMPRPNTCSNGGTWCITFKIRLPKIKYFKPNKKGLFLAL